MDAAFDQCDREGITFIPLAVETLGGWEAEAITQIRNIARGMGRRQSGDERVAIKHLFQRLAVILQRGNASLFLNRRRSFAPMSLVGD